MRLTTRSVFFSSSLVASLVASVACTSLLGDFEIVASTGPTDSGNVNQPETAAPVEAGPEVDANGPDAGPTQFIASYIAVGVNHTCAVRPPGSVFCWGSNEKGQLGSPPSATVGGKSNRPLKVPNLGAGFAQGKPITKVWVGGIHSCALDSDGSLFCWGGNDTNQLNTGDGIDANPHHEPKRVRGMSTTQPLLSGVASAALGVKHSCAILTNGDTVCWGNNTEGQTGDPAATARASGRPATKVPGIPPVKAVTAANLHTCVVTAQTGELWCWGMNSAGQIGPTGLNSVLVATKVNMPETPFFPSAGATHTCVTAGSPMQVYCFGANGSGQLGNDAGNMNPNPTLIRFTLGQVDRVEVGGMTSCARAFPSDPKLGCWGANTKGQLALGTRDTNAHVDITQVREIPPVKDGDGAFGVGLDYACAIGKASDKTPPGAVFCWGSGAFGKLGIDPVSTDDSPSPKPVILPE